MSVSLSNFFPEGTEYFYSFPAGEESCFFNLVPAWREELVSARPLVCAGPGVKVVVFNSTQNSYINSLFGTLGVSLTPQNNIIILPESIHSGVSGKKRNQLIKKALKKNCSKGKLVMAQPFLDYDLLDFYQFSPELSIWLNDKKNMPLFIPDIYLPKRYREFINGQHFFSSELSVTLPCVVKVSSSSSGDGVRICYTSEDLKQSQKEFSKIKGLIFIEEYINSLHNVGVQFGIPYDSSKPIEIIGVNEQLISSKGEYVGAIVDNGRQILSLDKINSVLLDDILPEIRKKGWYGVGGIDVLITTEGDFYFIDANFRMTAMTAYLLKNINKEFKHSLLTFTGSFKGSSLDFENKIIPLAKVGGQEQIMYMISLTEKESVYYFNAGLFFGSLDDLKTNVEQLVQLGVESRVLKSFKENNDFKSL